jgi:hypothetical protein
VERQRLYEHACMAHFGYYEYVCSICKTAVITELDMRQHFLVDHSKEPIAFHRQIDTELALKIETFLERCEQKSDVHKEMVEVQIADTEVVRVTNVVPTQHILQCTRIVTATIAAEAAIAVEAIDTQLGTSTKQDDDGHAQAITHLPLCVQCTQCTEYVPFRRPTLIDHVNETHLLLS